MKNVAAANGFPAGSGLKIHIVDFYNLDRFNIAIFREPGWHPIDFAPPVWRTRKFGNGVGRHDQIWQTRGPLDAVIENQCPGRITQLTLRGTATRPEGYSCKFFVAKRRIEFVILYANVFFHIPGWHGTGTVSQGRLVLDETRKWRDLVIGHQWHRRHTALSVAVLAATLQNWLDVLVKSDFTGLCGCDYGQSQREAQSCEFQGSRYGGNVNL